MAWWSFGKGKDAAAGRFGEDFSSSAMFARREWPGDPKIYGYRHWSQGDGETIDCLTYVTEGMAAIGQQELVLSLRCPAEAVPEEHDEAPELLRLLYRLALEKDDIEMGGFTRLGGFLGDGDLNGVAYLPPWPIPGLSLPEARLTVMPLYAEEGLVYQSGGMMRLISQLGYGSPIYPGGYWFDPDRRGRRPWSRLARETCLGQVTRVLATEATVFIADGEATLRMHGRDRLARQLALLGEVSALAILPGFDWAADGCLVWLPEQVPAQAKSPPRPGMMLAAKGHTGRIQAGFLLLQTGGRAPGCQLTEDGVAATLTRDDWRRVWRSLIQGEPVRISFPAPGLNLNVEYTTPATYHSPIDDLEYESIPEPLTSDPPAREQRPRREVVLLGDHSRQRVNAADWQDYLARLDGIMAQEITATAAEGHWQLAVRMTVFPAKPAEIRMAYRRLRPDHVERTEALQRVRKRLGALPPMAATGILQFELLYTWS